MWFRNKTKALPPPPPAPTSTPHGHRRITQPAPPVDVARWLLAEADQLDTEAAAKETQAEQLLSHAIEWRAVAAAKRALALTVPAAPTTPVAQPDPQPQPQPTPDERRSEPPSPIGCACQWWRGETCEQCDESVPQQISVTTPWSPAAEDTPVTYQPVNGWTR